MRHDVDGIPEITPDEYFRREAAAIANRIAELERIEFSDDDASRVIRKLRIIWQHRSRRVIDVDSGTLWSSVHAVARHLGVRPTGVRNRLFANAPQRDGHYYVIRHVDVDVVRIYHAYGAPVDHIKYADWSNPQ